MKLKHQLMVLGLSAGLVVPAFAGEKDGNHEDDGQKIKLSAAPAAVQATIAASLANGKVVKVERETEDGATTYEAKIKLPDGKELELEIASDGKVLKSKVETEDDEDDDKK